MAIPRKTSLVLDLDMENLIDYQGNTITSSGTALANDQLNRLNKARSFSAGTDVITLPAAGITDDILANGVTFTLSMWIYPTSTTGTERYLYYLIENSVIGLWLENDNTVTGWIRQSDGTTNVFATSTGTAALNTWSHVVFTSDGTNMQIYINDGADGSNTFNGTTQNTSAGNVIGNSANNTKDFIGSMSRPMIWSVALTAQEVQMLYADTASNYHDLFQDCVLYLDMNGDAKDVTNNNNDGTVTGATLTTDRFGIANRAYSFDGTNDKIVTGNLPSLSTNTGITVIYVGQLNTGTSNGGIVGPSAAGNSLWFYTDGVGNLSFYAGNSPVVPPGVIAGTDFSLDTWYVFTGRANASANTIDIFVDKSKNPNGGGTFATDSTATTALNLGMDYLSRYSKSTIGAVLVFNAPLTDEEIYQIVDLLQNKYIYPYPKKVTQ